MGRAGLCSSCSGVFFFFFFKQKTAYEMRISDWSSDVCSSDLRLDAHLAAHGPHLLGERLSAADFYLVMLMRWSRGMPKPAHEWTHLGALAQQIGRASCRERVCQYV